MVNEYIGDKKMDIEEEASVSEKSKCGRLSKFRSALGHIGLYVALMVYTAIGGLVFREMEYPVELLKLQKLQTSVEVQRDHFIGYVRNGSNLLDLESELHAYERTLQNAVQGGISLPENEFDARWNLLQAVFFASTVLTTIGYGNIVPVTFSGRMFCMLFALVGIPLTLTVIADMGRLSATAVSALVAKMRATLPDIAVFKRVNDAGKRSLSALAAILFLFVYLAAGAGIFMTWEEEWGFFEGFYFCFITMTTIGFGDLVPQNSQYMLICTLYILVGLALTSTIIELVRRQYAQSWRRLQALSGPMADALRRLGEGRGTMDVTALQRILTVVSVPRKNQAGYSKAKQQKEWEDAMAVLLNEFKASAAEDKPQRVFQIVIYESTV